MNKLAFSTLVELLRERAQEQPEQLAYIFLKDGDEVTVEIDGIGAMTNRCVEEK